MFKLSARLGLLIVTFLAFSFPADGGTHAQSSTGTVGTVSGNTSPYKVETTRWRAADGRFASWVLDGVTLSSAGALQLDGAKAQAGSDPYRAGAYRGGNFYNGGSYFVGEATGPMVNTGFAFSEAVASWNADTPAGTWIEVEMRARLGTGSAAHWSKWYNMGIWASGTETVQRHSGSTQADADGRVDVDTLKIGRASSPRTATGYQLRLGLFSTSRGGAVPSVRNAAVVVSTKLAAATGTVVQGNPAKWGKVLNVPECSQMVYPDGGEVWCSPTSVSMVLNYWAGGTGACSFGVSAAVSGVYDRVYDGHGNWPFNAAYAGGTAAGKREAYVTRFTSLAQAEDWIAAGVPVIMSIGWGRGQLTGAPISASNGHLVVLAGFDARGNPVVNDPAAPSNEAVQRTYQRAQLEKLWLQASGGTAYLVYPAGRAVPRLP